MKEGREGKAVLEDDVDSETFIRAVQWAYTGNYHTSKVEEGAIKPSKSDADNNHRPQITPSVTILNSVPANLHRFASKRFHSGRIPHQSLSAFLNTDVIRRQEHKAPGVCPRSLVAHAKLYVFADRYLIDDLKGLVLHKLYTTLLTFPLLVYPHTLGTFIKLLAYVYENPTSETLQGPQPRPPLTILYMSQVDSPRIAQDCFPPEDAKNIVDIRPNGDPRFRHYKVAFNSAEACQTALDRQPPERRTKTEGYNGPLMKLWTENPPRLRARELKSPAPSSYGPMRQGPAIHPYTANNESIRDLVVDYAVAYKRDLVEEPEFMTVFDTHPEAGKAIFKKSVEGKAGLAQQREEQDKSQAILPIGSPISLDTW